MKRNIIAIAGLFGSFAALENEASAAQGFQEFIPASACQLEDEEDIGKADLVDGSWLIDASVENDSVELLCPVRIPPFFWNGLSLTEVVWSHIQIYYRDPDGTSTSHSVTAYLKKISKTALSPTTLHTIVSNAKVSVPTTTDTRYTGYIGNFELDDSQHFVRVVMKQGSNNGTDRVRFTRIRLFTDPQW